MKRKKQLEKLDEKKREKLKSAIKFIAKRPFCGKKLKGKLNGLRSYRIGSYRIIYKIEEGVIDIVSIVPRKDAY